jgi:PD-(D/E)XK nuclease superfamily protein
VLLPLTESAAYDLAVADRRKLQRVQCKYTSTGLVDLRNIHSNSQGYVVKRLAANAYDWLCVLHADGRESLLQKCLAGRRSVSLAPMTPLEEAPAGLAS